MRKEATPFSGWEALGQYLPAEDPLPPARSICLEDGHDPDLDFSGLLGLKHFPTKDFDPKSGESVDSLLMRLKAPILHHAKNPDRILAAELCHPKPGVLPDSDEGFYSAGQSKPFLTLEVKRSHLLKNPEDCVFRVCAAFCGNTTRKYLAVRDSPEWRFIRTWPVARLLDLNARFLDLWRPTSERLDLLTIAAIWLFTDPSRSGRDGFALIPDHPNVFRPDGAESSTARTPTRVDVDSFVARICCLPNNVPALKVFYRPPAPAANANIQVGYLWQGMTPETIRAWLFAHDKLPTLGQALSYLSSHESPPQSGGAMPGFRR